MMNCYEERLRDWLQSILTVFTVESHKPVHQVFTNRSSELLTWKPDEGDVVSLVVQDLVISEKINEHCFIFYLPNFKLELRKYRA